MARPQKLGLDYFNLDVVLDDKVELMEAKCGLEGFAIVIKLWQKIYSNGYYIDWQEDNLILFCRKINADISLVNSVIDECFNREIFNRNLFEKYKILTSNGIQKRYLVTYKQLKRSYIPMKESYLLINSELTDIITELIPDEDKVIPELMQQRKGKEMKREETDEEKTPPIPYENIKNLYNEICGSLTQIRSLSDNRKKKLKTRWQQLDCNIDNFRDVFERVESSSFCKGNNDRGWKADFDWIIKNDENIIKILEGKYADKEELKQTLISIYPDL